MPEIFVTIIGDQPAPNIFLIKDKTFQDISHYIFITSELMEEKNRLAHLLNAVSIPKEKYSIVQISPNNLYAIRQKLDTLALKEGNNNYHVNITSGSKMMSIGIFNYFTQPSLANRSALYYISIRDHHFLQIFPEAEHRAIQLSHKISLNEYLNSYGIRVNETRDSSLPVYSRKLAEKIHDLFLSNAPILPFNKKFSHLISDLRNYAKEEEKKAKGPLEISIKDDQKWSTLISMSGFLPQSSGRLNADEIQYLIGGWFEEWTYYQLKAALGLETSAIGCSMQLQRVEAIGDFSKNEFDVLFTYQNQLYVLECKSGLGGGYPGAKRMFDQAAHRLAAIRSDFGLKVHTSFLTLSTDLRKNAQLLKPAIENRSLSLNIQTLDQKDLSESPSLWVKKITGFR
ncbi:MAG: DUF1887 family CARF protein [Saprospiraceae bacterium]